MAVWETRSSKQLCQFFICKAHWFCCHCEAFTAKAKMPKSSIYVKDSAADVTRQAELVVMDCLKSWNCPRALDAFMAKSSTSRVSAMASERFSKDMSAKKKASDGPMSLLEYLISTTSEIKDKSVPTSRRRTGSGTPAGKEGEVEAVLEWTKEEVSALKKAIKKTGSVEDKNARWKQIATLVGKAKKHCYLKYKELKQEQTNAAKKTSPHRKRSSNKSDSSEPSATDANTDDKLAKNDDNLVLDKSTEENAPTTAELPLSKVSNGSATAFVVSRRAAPDPQVQISSEVLEMEDCEDVGTLHHQPAAGRDRPSRATSNVGSSFAAGTTRVPTSSDVAAVQQLLFGLSKKTFSAHWEEQGFVFSTVRDLQYGLVQHQGGPCGILAVVQAYVLRFLLQRAPVDWKNPTAPHQERVLVQALAHILWQAARTSRVSECVVAVKENGGANRRRFMTGLKLHVAATEEQAQQILTAHLSQFMDSQGSGLVQFVLSVLLTKGVETIKSEMDQLAGDSGGQLIGAHDYCTQEIVNLLLCGYARSNVFDGDQVLEGASASDPDAVVLHGISSQSVIGFLSLFEAYQNLVVGSYLKQPLVNVWVVCSESHYSVLFAADPRSLEDRALATQPKLHLLYYDGLANQDEEICLTVDTMALEEQSSLASHDDLIPPLNLVIKTKWPRATVDWNVEPLL
ncbi:putative ubiquitin carboxyl-terminal hydrolase MINDY-4 [Phytophthora citrophthora]|uniref:Ubiquitin carboxyl-terminal hydrolase MINDY-4 n=1 Tax=Phytophthora citrophthora TaxID=4793 RepID=A0AAD9G675_9STRA|nr:putative ubiquitin carboxyl-terminal hydrolase MINDY-4 [Phytophthora citrophthora]